MIRKSKIESTDVVVIGAGPAGLMAAIAAAENGARVIICEYLKQSGTKLLATGGGRCNITNTLQNYEFLNRFGKHGKFMRPAISSFDSKALIKYLANINVRTIAEDGYHVFPVTDSAKTVRDALENRCLALSISIFYNTRIEKLKISNSKIVGVISSNGDIKSKFVVIASGGKGYPHLGATGDGYQMAADSGHRIVSPTPALVPLIARENWPGRCAGVSISPARIWIDLPKQNKTGVTGDLVFTHRGLSGPVVHDISGDVAELLLQKNPVPIRIDFAPDISAEQWQNKINQARLDSPKKLAKNIIDQYLPSSLAEILCNQAGNLADKRVADLTKPQMQSLISSIMAHRLHIAKSEGFQHAMATRGGIDIREINPNTLESKIVNGLFFAGETIDIDGPTGGFNLQWAFSSGYLAGISGAKMISNKI